MDTLNAQIIKKNGKREYAILPYEEFLKIQKQLQDYEDLRLLREAKETEKNASTVGIDELKKKMGARASRSSKNRKSGE